MIRAIKTPTHLNNLSLKLLAILFGYLMWHTISLHQKIRATIAVPVSFYHLNQATLQAPDTVSVTLKIQRKQLQHLKKNLAIHIDAQELPFGNSTVTLDRSHLFVPEGVNVLCYNPSQMMVIKK